MKHSELRAAPRSAGPGAGFPEAIALVALLALLVAAGCGPALGQNDGPNQDGMLILHAPLDLAFTFDGNFNDQSNLYDCKDAITRISPQDDPPNGVQTVVFYALLAFSNYVSPRVKALSFGINYSSPQMEPIAYGASGWDPWEVADDNWPLSGSGTAVTWTNALTRQINEVYWFACYYYDGNTFKVTGHPRLGGEIVDDEFPPHTDYIGINSTPGNYDGNYYGMIGFGKKGNNPCSEDERYGACCSRSGACVLQTQGGCGLYSGYIYLGDDTYCSPNPCLPGTGACCRFGDCTLLEWDDCIDARGTFMGEGVGCEPSPCGFGQSETTWGVVKRRYSY